jgi:hypothetical protein
VSPVRLHRLRRLRPRRGRRSPRPRRPRHRRPRSPNWVVSFRRAGGQVDGLDIGSDRMWKLALKRTGSGACHDKR